MFGHSDSSWPKGSSQVFQKASVWLGGLGVGGGGRKVVGGSEEEMHLRVW